MKYEKLKQFIGFVPAIIMLTFVGIIEGIIGFFWYLRAEKPKQPTYYNF